MDRTHTSEAEEECTESDGNLFTLRYSTLTALTSFLDEQTAELEAMASLAIQQDCNSVPSAEFLPSQLALSNDHTRPQADKTDVSNQLGTLESRSQPKALQVEEYKRIFKENWQLSQFCPQLSLDTAWRLAQAIKQVCDVNAHIAFMCCPTGYVAFKEITLPSQNVVLLEYDRRFSIIAGPNFIHYDLDESLLSPPIEALHGSQDVVVVDPPFHSEMSQKKIASTIARILRPGGRLVLLTGLTLSPLIDSIYGSPLPKLHQRDIVIDHDGLGQLATPYGCWVGGGSDSRDRAFGNPICNESSGS